jgi:hypothetical protein
MANDYTAAEMADLTPDEREALAVAQGTDTDEIQALADEDDAAGDAAGEQVAAKAADEQPAPTAEDVAAAAALAAAPEATQQQKDAAQAVTAAFEAAQEAQKIEPTKGLSEFDRESRDDAAAAREALLNTKDEAFKKLLDGEIEPSDYQKIERDTQAQLEALTAAAITDKVTDKISRAQLRSAWIDETNSAIGRLAEAGVPIESEASQIELDALIKAYGNVAGANGMSDAGLVASKWALKEAERTMLLRHGKTGAKPAAAAAPAAPKADTKGAAQRPTLQTLGGLPAADRNDTGDDVMGKIGIAQGEDLELMIAHMSKEEVKGLLARSH